MGKRGKPILYRDRRHTQVRLAVMRYRDRQKMEGRALDIICHKCDTRAKDTDNFCINCGAALKEIITVE